MTFWKWYNNWMVDVGWGWSATGDFKKPGFSQKPGFCWAKRLKNIRLNAGRGQSIRTEIFVLFINSYRPNAIAPTRFLLTNFVRLERVNRR